MREDLKIEQLKISLAPIASYLEDARVTDIYIYGYNRVFVKRLNQPIEQIESTWRCEDDLLTAAMQIGRYMGRPLDSNNPILDSRIPDGSRVNVVIKPVYSNGAAITIRKFHFSKLEMEDLVKSGTLNGQIIELLKSFIAKRKNILISGGTGVGKTTLLNAICSLIPKTDIIVTCEDSREISLTHPFWAPMEAKHALFDDDREISLRELVKNALRMNPKWILIGEIRGSEAVDLMRAFNTGHAGFATIHANAPLDALLALDNLVLQGLDMRIEAIRQLISRAVNVVVQMVQLENDRRVVAEISEVRGLDYSKSMPQYVLDSLFKSNK